MGVDARGFPGGLLRLDPAFAYVEPPSSWPLPWAECLTPTPNSVWVCFQISLVYGFVNQQSTLSFLMWAGILQLTEAWTGQKGKERRCLPFLLPAFLLSWDNYLLLPLGQDLQQRFPGFSGLGNGMRITPQLVWIYSLMITDHGTSQPLLSYESVLSLSLSLCIYLSIYLYIYIYIYTHTLFILFFLKILTSIPKLYSI